MFNIVNSLTSLIVRSIKKVFIFLLILPIIFIIAYFVLLEIKINNLFFMVFFFNNLFYERIFVNDNLY